RDPGTNSASDYVRLYVVLRPPREPSGGPLLQGVPQGRRLLGWNILALQATSAPLAGAFFPGSLPGCRLGRTFGVGFLCACFLGVALFCIGALGRLALVRSVQA